MGAETRTTLLSFVMIIVGGLIGGFVSSRRARRKDNRFVLDQRAVFEKLLTDAEILSRNPNVGNTITETLASLRKEFSAMVVENTKYPTQAWKQKQQINRMIDQLSSVVKAVSERIKTLQDATTGTFALFSELQEAIKAQKDQKLSFEQDIEFRLAIAHYAIAREIFERKPVNWLMLHKVLHVGRDYASHSRFNPIAS